MKALEGNKGKRNLEKETIPQFEANDPGCPERLSPKAKIVWNKLAPLLVEKGLLTDAFQPAFETLCTACALVDDIEIKMIAQPDIELQIAKGYVNAFDKMAKLKRNYLQLFGLSPVDLVRIKGIEAPKKSKLELFLSKSKNKPA